MIRDVWRIEAGWWDRNIMSVHPAPVAESTAAILVAVADKEAVLAAGAATSIAASISSVST
jgi:hypothetical protein